MKRGFWAVAILLLAVVAMLVFFAAKKPADTAQNNPILNPSGIESDNPSATQNSSRTTQDGSFTNSGTPENLATKAGELAPPPTATTNVPPLIILQNARRAIVQYAQVFGGNPVGNNPEITAELMGNNPKHLNFITPDSGLLVNEQGEMLDAWGTPLFFHQLSGHETEIHSAGPDKVMWTIDDLVTK